MNQGLEIILIWSKVLVKGLRLRKLRVMFHLIPIKNTPPTQKKLFYLSNLQDKIFPLEIYHESLTQPFEYFRNIARETAQTHYVFPSDLELYPSPGLIPSFLKMVISYFVRERNQISFKWTNTSLVWGWYLTLCCLNFSNYHFLVY